MLPREAHPAARTARLAARPLSSLAAALGCLILLVAVPGCGDGDGDPPPAGDGEATELRFVLFPAGPDGPSREAELRCPAAEAAGREACASLDDVPRRAIEPVPADAVCTQIYGGPDVVRVEGTLEGEPVEAELTRRNGCEIDRFERFRDVLTALFPGYRPGRALSP